MPEMTNSLWESIVVSGVFWILDVVIIVMLLPTVFNWWDQRRWKYARITCYDTLAMSAFRQAMVVSRTSITRPTFLGLPAFEQDLEVNRLRAAMDAEHSMRGSTLGIFSAGVTPEMSQNLARLNSWLIIAGDSQVEKMATLARNASNLCDPRQLERWSAGDLHRVYSDEERDEMRREIADLSMALPGLLRKILSEISQASRQIDPSRRSRADQVLEELHPGEFIEPFEEAKAFVLKEIDWFDEQYNQAVTATKSGSRSPT